VVFTVTHRRVAAVAFSRRVHRHIARPNVRPIHLRRTHTGAAGCAAYLGSKMKSNDTAAFANFQCSFFSNLTIIRARHVPAQCAGQGGRDVSGDREAPRTTPLRPCEWVAALCECAWNGGLVDFVSQCTAVTRHQSINQPSIQKIRPFHDHSPHDTCLDENPITTN